MTANHGLRLPDEAFFFYRNLNFLGLGRQILVYFWPIYQHPFWYSKSLVHIFINQTLLLINKPLYPLFIWDWYLNLGCKELESHEVSVVRAANH
jgi:hypothetical protein